MRSEDRKPSKRVFPLLQNLDLDTVTFANIQDVGDPITIQDMNEQEMYDLVLVNLARLVCSGEWSGLLTAGGGHQLMPGGASTAPGVGAAVGAVVQYPMFYPQSRSETSGNGVVRFNDEIMNLLPFWVSKSGTMDTLTIRLASTNDDDLMVALYSTGSDGVPDAIIGTAVEWDMGTSGVVTLDLSGVGDWAVTAEGNYWLGLMLKTDTTNRPTFYIFNTTEGPSFTVARNSSATKDYLLEAPGFYVVGLSAGVPPSTISGAEEDSAAQVPWMSYTLA